MIHASPVRQIADLVASNPVRMVPLLHDLLPKDARSKRRDKQAKAIANLPKPEIIRILVALQRAV